MVICCIIGKRRDLGIDSITVSELFSRSSRTKTGSGNCGPLRLFSSSCSIANRDWSSLFNNSDSALLGFFAINMIQEAIGYYDEK